MSDLKKWIMWGAISGAVLVQVIFVVPYNIYQTDQQQIKSDNQTASASIEKLNTDLNSAKQAQNSAEALQKAAEASRDLAMNQLNNRSSDNSSPLLGIWEVRALDPKFILPNTNISPTGPGNYYPDDGNGKPVLFLRVELYMGIPVQVNSIELAITGRPLPITSTRPAFEAHSFNIGNFSDWASSWTYFLGVTDEEKGHSAKIVVNTDKGSYPSKPFTIPTN